jgi:hypothetical protein
VKKPKRIYKPKPAPCLVPCECGKKTQVTLIPGANDVHLVCECGAVLNIDIVYDGFGVATIQKGTIEKVEP